MQHDDQPEPPSASSTTVFTDMDTLHSATTGPSTLSPEDSPRLADLLPPSNDMDMQSPDFTPIGPQYEAPLYHPASGATEHLKREVREDDVEEIARQPPVSAGQESWVMGIPSPAPSSTSSSSSETTVKVITEPQLPSGGPEMLMLRFDRQTCGILSVKDGPTENPWRTLIWPLARDNKALYHAIASMTSFHASKHAHEIRVQGISHMHSCFRALRTTGMENMPVDTAIATALVLGFAESWDQHTSTGINHIKGAKALVNQALIQHRHSPLQGEKLRRLRFLCNTWVYMDVIARLTSFDDDDTTDFDHVINLSPMPLSSTPMFPSAPQSPMLVSDGVIDASLDPLMGFASRLFPIIGRVANLVRRVRRTSCNSPAIISAAVSLKTALEEWIPPPLSAVEDPEDPSSNVQHNLQTAEAYRWATLLYLHQAVPEIPSLSSTELGKKVLGILATVPLSSRAVIVQIFPLTAGGCEAMDDETRQWVRDRWENMGRRMKIGVIDRCAEVCSEVWRRRDEYEVVCQARSARSSTGLVNRFSRELTSPDTFCNDLFGMDEGLDSRAFALHAGHPEGSTRRKTTNRLTEQARMRIAHDWTRKQSRDAITGEVDPEYTIRGSLHWLGVMKDWDWEGKQCAPFTPWTCTYSSQCSSADLDLFGEVFNHFALCEQFLLLFSGQASLCAAMCLFDGISCDD